MDLATHQRALRHLIVGLPGALPLGDDRYLDEVATGDALAEVQAIGDR